MKAIRRIVSMKKKSVKNGKEKPDENSVIKKVIEKNKSVKANHKRENVQYKCYWQK